MNVSAAKLSKRIVLKMVHSAELAKKRKKELY